MIFLNSRCKVLEPAMRKFHLLSLSFLSALAVWGVEPFPLRMGSSEQDLSTYDENGFNAFVTVDFNHLPVYRDPDLPFHLPRESHGEMYFQRVQRTRRALATLIRRARKYKLELCLRMDEVVFPAPIWEYLLKHAPDYRNPHRINFESDLFWKYYRSKYRETLALLPSDVKYIIVQTGELPDSTLAPYRGQTIFDQSYDSRYVWMMAQFIKETKKLVVDEGKRILIWRTWDPRPEGFHANPEIYRKVLSALPNLKGVFFSMKYLQNDFWMYDDPNPSIGKGEARQIIEFQTARHYEGKGAFPNYLGVEHARAIRSARATGIVDGVWCWGGQEGGQGGPFLKNDLWCRMNLETTAALIHDPTQTPEGVLLQWLERTFGRIASRHLLPVFLKTRECVVKTLSISDYACRHRGESPSRNLILDDLIRGDRVLGKEGGLPVIYEDVKDRLSEVFQEKRDAVSLAYELRERFEYEKKSIVEARGERLYDEALTGFIYLQKLSSLMCHYIRGMFLYYQWRENKQQECATAALQELEAWRVSWKDFTESIPELPAAPTLFRSLCTHDPSSENGAMVDTCERAIKSLSQR